MIEKIFLILGNNPSKGAGITTGTFFTGVFMENIVTHMEMISLLLQIIAFAVTITVGVMTMISINKKNRKDND